LILFKKEIEKYKKKKSLGSPFTKKRRKKTLSQVHSFIVDRDYM